MVSLLNSSIWSGINQLWQLVSFR